MEIQLTDFENAAYAIFTVLLTRAILSYGLNFYIPIGKVNNLTTYHNFLLAGFVLTLRQTQVDENMHTAHARDAVRTKKFWFRKDIFPSPPPRYQPSASNSTSATPSTTPPPLPPVEDEFTLFTINEIINGTAPNPATNTPGFIGLIPLIESYLNTVNIDVETRCAFSDYLDLVGKRASGELMTGARWIREFVGSHPDYKGDSMVGQRVNYDLVKAVEKLGMGTGGEVLGSEKLLGRWRNRK